MANERGLLPKARREELDEHLQRQLDRWYRNAYQDDNLFLTMALRFADRMTAATRPSIDPAFHEALRWHFSDDQILDLGMTIAFASGWQRFIEAFGIVPDRWAEGSPPPFHPLMR